MDVRPGGNWPFIMHGPDSVHYKNICVYVEVVEPEHLVYDHISGPHFCADITLADEDGKTGLTMRIIFESSETRDKVAKEFSAIEGLIQTLERLKEYLPQM